MAQQLIYLATHTCGGEAHTVPFSPHPHPQSRRSFHHSQVIDGPGDHNTERCFPEPVPRAVLARRGDVEEVHHKLAQLVGQH